MRELDFNEKTIADQIILDYKESKRIHPTVEIDAKMYSYGVINKSGKGAIFFHVLNENIGVVGFAVFFPLTRKLIYYDYKGDIVRIQENMEFKSQNKTPKTIKKIK